MKKLFFFTEFYHPVQNTTGYYVTKIVHAAARSLGVPVTVCCAVPCADELPAGRHFHVDRIRAGQYDKNATAQRIFKHALLTIKFTLRALQKVKRHDVVFAVTNPAFLMVALAMLRKLKSFRYVLLVYDVHPENLIPAGLAKRNSLRYRLARRCFNWAYRSADQLIVIGRDMEEVIRGKVGPACRIVQIPNWADVDKVKPQPKEVNALIRAHGLLDKRVFLFAGNLGRVQGIANLLEAIRRVQSPSAAFLFVGDGVFREEIETFAREHPDKAVIHLGPMPMSAQPTFLNACDVAFVTLDAAMYGLGVPSKSYFAMAAGKPLLLVADAESEIGRVIFEEDIGWVVPPNRPDELAAKIDEICALDVIAERGRRARKVAERRFSEEVVLSQYADYFRTLADQNQDQGQPSVSPGRRSVDDVPVRSPVYSYSQSRLSPESSPAPSAAEP